MGEGGSLAQAGRVPLPSDEEQLPTYGVITPISDSYLPLPDQEDYNEVLNEEEVLNFSIELPDNQKEKVYEYDITLPDIDDDVFEYDVDLRGSDFILIRSQ